MIGRVVLAADQLTIELNSEQIQACQDFDWAQVDEGQQPTSSTWLYRPAVKRHRKQVILTLAIQIKRLDGKRMLLSPDGQDLFMPGDLQPKDHIVKAIGNAYRWREILTEENLTLTQLAGKLGISDSQIRKYLPLINLGPGILKKALDGTLPPSLTLTNLLKAAHQLDWQKQAAFLGLDRLKAMPRNSEKSR